MKTIAIFLHQPYCSVQSVNGIIKSLSSNYNFKIFTKHELEDNFFDDVNAIAIPGGVGDADTFDRLFPTNVNRVSKFVNEGGAYLGICMGAYWAGPKYLNIIQNVKPVQYIKRPNTDTRRPHPKAQSVSWNDTTQKMFFYDGCALIGDGIKNSKIISRYPNGDAMAIIQNNIGLIGCHPESEKHWYESYSWMKKHWHYEEHHKLLLDFCKEYI